jgi:hypothetical protein
MKDEKPTRGRGEGVTGGNDNGWRIEIVVLTVPTLKTSCFAMVRILVSASPHLPVSPRLPVSVSSLRVPPSPLHPSSFRLHPF